MTSLFRRFVLACLLAPVGLAAQAQCITISTVNSALAENFDALANTGTSNTALPPGWAFLETGTGANATYAAGTGSDTGGNTYSFGASGATDRAFGGLQSGSVIPTLGACYTNNTGAAITSIDVAYTGEQWRLGAASRVDRLDFQLSTDATGLGNGTWSDTDALDFTAPVTTGTAGARDGNAAGNNASVAGSIGSLSIPQGATFWIRWTDLNATSSDDGLAIDNFSLTAQGSGGGGQPLLRISDTSAVEGDSGDKEFMFTLSLSAPAGAGGVQVSYATADGTAAAGSDYAAVGAGTATIPAGENSLVIGVFVHGDTAQEANETFLVDITGATGASVADAQGVGTIVNDDLTLTAIHDIQGSGNTSPLAGTAINTRGIVTGRKSNGFFLQARDADADGNPATSEGVFVFTSTAPPAAAQIGNEVIVSGTVVEFVPAADPNQLSLTEITTPTVTLVATGNALPGATLLTPTFPDPAGPLDQLERLEGMRVTAASFTVVAATAGTVSEANATATSNGQAYLVVTGTPRPFREPGIQAPDQPPGGGSIPPIPRWDFNPELLFSDTDALGAPRLDLAAGATLANYMGPLDYGFRRYSIHQDPNVAPSVTPGPAASAARTPTADEFTVASYNVERFFDTTDDPAIGEPVLTATAYANRLAKLSLGVRNYLHMPDILGLVEVENLSTAQAIAARINADAVAAGQPNPAYVAYLQEGNDVGGIDVGYLVKTAEVAPGVARVQDVVVTQLGKATTWTQPDGASVLLNDRPPLRLDARIRFADGRAFTISTILVHQRSLNGAGDDTPDGDRIRRKRQKQAEYLAGVVQAAQATDPQLRILVMGDFNAFEFNDGLADAMGTVHGVPSADEATAVPGDGQDLVDPDLLNLYVEEPLDQRYSFEFDGNAQSLDHILINQALGIASGTFSLDHARINVDRSEVERTDPASAARLSDHDPTIAYFSTKAADLSVVVTAAPNTGPVGEPMRFKALLQNAGSDGAEFPALGFAFDTELPDLVVQAPAGWACEAPLILDGTTSLSCYSDYLPAASSSEFIMNATVPNVDRLILLAASAISQTGDPDNGNNRDTEIFYPQANTDFEVQWDSHAELGSEALSIIVINHGPTGATPGPPMLTIRGNVDATLVDVVNGEGYFCVEEDQQPGRRFSARCFFGLPFEPSQREVRLRVMAETGFETLGMVFETELESTTDRNLSNNKSRIWTVRPNFPLYRF